MALEHTPTMSVEEYFRLEENNPDTQYEYPRSMRIEIYRKEQKKWIYGAFEAGDEVELASLGVHFPIIDAYEDVVFKKDRNNKRSGK
ncbi:MAG TPA: hypothetical protein VKR06_38990 [Ktedonosporobacter sp.]|nr:hypothetical protein [Ktedonosporobacter sp.]